MPTPQRALDAASARETRSAFTAVAAAECSTASFAEFAQRRHGWCARQAYSPPVPRTHRRRGDAWQRYGDDASFGAITRGALDDSTLSDVRNRARFLGDGNSPVDS